MSATRAIRQFYRNPENAFKDGFHLRRKSKRVNDGLYWKYHYFLPASIMPVINFLKGYFEIIDSICDVPVVHRFRNSKMEYAMTAVDVLYEIRNRLAVNDEIVLGSEFINPCAWAVIGHNRRGRLARKEFRSLKQIFKHYEQQVTGCRGYNCAVILHRQDETVNRLALMAEKERKSVNLILAVALLLLHDIIKNCGPDCNELKRVFTNDRRASPPETITGWAQACSKHKTPSGQEWSISRDRASYDAAISRFSSKKKYEATMPAYSPKYDYNDFMSDYREHFQQFRQPRKRLAEFAEVEFVDLGFTALITDEKTFNFGEFKTNSKNGRLEIEIEDIDNEMDEANAQLMGAGHIAMLEGWME